ncbi:hypothetical protein ACIBCD_42585 [Nocardia brasiliensis]
MTLEQVAADFGAHPTTLSKWMRQVGVDDESWNHAQRVSRVV